MKLNQATDYGFRMVLYMSILPFGTKITGAELANALNIPNRFLLKIMRNLTKAEIMKSYRGVDGGFTLGRNSNRITLLDVVEAIEGPAFLQKCLYDPNSCTRGCEGVCAVREAFIDLNKEMVKSLKSVNFEDLAAREKELRKVE